MSFRFGDFTFDLANKYMLIADGVTEVDAQAIYNAAQEWGAEPSNMIYDTILTGGGKFALDAAETKFTGLVVRMDKVDAPGPADTAWAVQFADAAGPGIELRRVFGGDFISQDVSPVAPSAFTYIVVEQATSPTLIQAGTSGLTADESAKLDRIHGQGGRSIYIDTNGPNGTGYQEAPFNNFTDAAAESITLGIKSFIVTGNVATLDRALVGYTIRGVGNPRFELAGFNVNGCEFYDLELAGTMLGTIHAHNCELRDGMVGLNGDFFTCGLGGDLTIAASAKLVMVDCYSSLGGIVPRPTLTFGLGNSDVSIRSYRGGLTVFGVDGISDEVTIGMAQGKLTLDSTCTDGAISVRGVAQFTDNSAGSTVDTTALVNQVTIASAVWDALLSAHVVAGSFGEWIGRKLLSVAKFVGLK
jgi:hypothetical protein